MSDLIASDVERESNVDESQSGFVIDDRMATVIVDSIAAADPERSVKIETRLGNIQDKDF